MIEIIIAIATVILAIATVALSVGTFWLAYEAHRARIDGLETLDVATREAREAKDSRKADHLRRRGESTMGATQHFVEQAALRHAELLCVARSQGITVTELWARRDSVSDGRECGSIFARYLDELEILAVGVRLGVYDVHVVEHIARGFIVRLWEQAQPYVRDRRQGSIQYLPAHPTAYEHAEWLAKQLGESKSPAKLDGTLPEV